MLCGSAPLPAPSGKTQRHRLNRGGDRAANSALHMAAICRLRIDPRTKAYAACRTADGLSKRETIRCLKRYLAREAYHLLTSPGELTTGTRPGHPPPTSGRRTTRHPQGGHRPSAQRLTGRRRPLPAVDKHEGVQGSQHVSMAFGQAARDAGITRSMGSVGDCHDNAVAESFFATLKKELVRRRAWPSRRELTSE